MKQKFFLIIAAILGIVAGGVISLFQKPYVEVSRSFVVRNERHATSSVYDYEGFYTLQTANEAAHALMTWLVSPGGVQAVYRDAGIAVPFRKLRAYERAFSIQRADTPFFEVRFKAEEKRNAEKLSASLEGLLTQELAAFQNSSSLSLGASTPVVIERSVPLARNIAYGALLTFALALFAALFRAAIQQKEADI